ncbi:MAG: Fur family transcriptional regulator [candidate division WOR-3 bacterium]
MKEELMVFLDFLRAKGHRITTARAEVAKRVFALHEHFTAEELQFLLRARRISRATVYRTLSLMVESGLVKEYRFGQSGRLYEHVIGHPRHFHLVCDQCGAIEEINCPSAAEALSGDARKSGYQVLGIDVVVHGICGKCRKAKR